MSTITQSCEILPLITSQSSHNQVSTSSSSERTANHTLNRDNLLKNLVRDAHSDKADVYMEVNNSGGNVNLQCNSGIFLAVVKPAFSNFSNGFSAIVQGINISMPNPPTLTKDSTNLNQTFLYQFDISPPPPVPPKRASVHLHLTARLVQVQGGARLTDSSTVAVWFTTNIVLPLLKECA